MPSSAFARRLGVPVMVGVSEGEREFIGVKEVAVPAQMAREEYGTSTQTTLIPSIQPGRPLRPGFDEIIFDASRKPFAQNLKVTKEAVQAKQRPNQAGR